MSKSSPKNSWTPAGKATLAGLGLLVVVTRVLVSSTGNPEKERSQRAEIQRISAEARRLNDEGEMLSKQLEELSEAVGWRSPSVDSEARPSRDPMLARIIDGARISFEEQASPAWKELDALTDDELIARVGSLRDEIERARRPDHARLLSGLAQRLQMATAILKNRGLAAPSESIDQALGDKGED